MSDTVTELRIMARKLAQGSIVTKALGQYIFQIMSAVNDDTIQPLRDEIERLRAENATLRQQLGGNQGLPDAMTTNKPSVDRATCRHVHDHVVCAGGGSAFNVYRCRYCGDEDWL